MRLPIRPLAKQMFILIGVTCYRRKIKPDKGCRVMRRLVHGSQASSEKMILKQILK